MKSKIVFLCYYCKYDNKKSEPGLCEKCTDYKHLQVGQNVCLVCNEYCNTYKWCRDCYLNVKKNKYILINGEFPENSIFTNDKSIDVHSLDDIYYFYNIDTRGIWLNKKDTIRNLNETLDIFKIKINLIK